FQPRSKLLSLALQQRQDFRLGPVLGLLGVEFVEYPEKIKPHQRGQALLVYLFPDARGDGHMREHPRHGSHLRRCHKSVLVLRNILRNLNRVFPNGSKRLRQFFAAVNAHGITSLWDCPPYPGRTLTSMRLPGARSRFLSIYLLPEGILEKWGRKAIPRCY